MITSLHNHYHSLFVQPHFSKEIRKQFLQRLEAGDIARDENTKTHFCVYFAANDPQRKQVLLGKHKKSGLWLFNGGHINKNELPEDAVLREMDEELGIKGERKELGSPFLLTVQPIHTPPNYPCKVHYDIWYSLTMDKDSFYPDQAKLGEEFSEAYWMSIDEARKLTKSESTQQALDILEKKFLY